MPTRVFTITPGGFVPEDLDEPARILAEGGLVGIPTETVYGIAARADDPAAIERLIELKQRPSSKPFSVHIADPEDLTRVIEEIPPGAQSLMDHFWPGPLTIIFPGGDRGIGIRLPAHPVARELIRRSGVQIVAPSANPIDLEPAIDAQGVLRYFEDRIDAVVDAGPVTIREASTVVRLESDGRFEVLREGIITSRMVHRALRGRGVLFVCTGNSCRSPMAMALARELLSARLGVSIDELPTRGFQIESAGIAAFGGGCASSQAVEVMSERGIELAGHRSRPVTREMIEQADLIIALGHGHRDQLLAWDPSLADRVMVISETGIADPIGGDLEIYRRCAFEIERELEARWIGRIEEL